MCCPAVSLYFCSSGSSYVSKCSVMMKFAVLPFWKVRVTSVCSEMFCSESFLNSSMSFIVVCMFDMRAVSFLVLVMLRLVWSETCKIWFVAWFLKVNLLLFRLHVLL